MKKKLIITAVCVALVLLIVAALVIIPRTSLADLFVKKIKVGFSDNPPYSFQSKDTGGSGFSCDLAAKIFESLGYKVIFVKVTPDTKNSMLQSGEIDCYIDATTTNIEKTYYSKDYLACIQGTFYNNPEIKLYSKKDLKNYKCSFVAGSSAADFLKELGAQTKPEIDAEAAANAVKEGKADICVIDNYFINDLTENHTGYSGFKSGIYLYNEKHYFAFSEETKDLAEDVNNAILQLKKDKTVERLVNLYGLYGFAS